MSVVRTSIPIKRKRDANISIETVEVVDCDSDIEAIEDTKVVDLSEEPESPRSKASRLNKPTVDSLIDIYKCPICLCNVQEITSTICGHLFCKDCISYSISKLHTCPICKTVLDHNQIHRIYFS